MIEMFPDMGLFAKHLQKGEKETFTHGCENTPLELGFTFAINHVKRNISYAVYSRCLLRLNKTK